jgi:glycosyltransferase 2 family protein
VRRSIKLPLQILVSGAVIAFLLWQIDLGTTVDILRESDWSDVAASLAIVLATTLLMAWRWWALLGARGVHEPYRWLVEMYFVGNAAGQVLPTAIGGDAVRIIEHARRRPDARATAAGAVVMERILGMVITLVLVAVALAVAAGRYEGVRLLVVIELVCVAGVVVLGILLFSPRLGHHLERRLFPLGRRIRLEQPLVSLYRAMHEYRHTPRVLLSVLGLTLVAQSARVVSIWLCGEAVGIDVSAAVYVILGPLLFFVQMIPFTLNGLGVREAFFVGFLARFGVDAEAALAVGLLYFAVSIAAALPGGLILLWRSLRPVAPRSQT